MSQTATPPLVTRVREGLAALLIPGYAEFRKTPLDKPPRPSPQLGESAWLHDSFFAGKGIPWEPWNPDPYIRTKGWEVYDRMMRDDQVKAAYSFTVDSIVSRKYHFVVPDADNEDKAQEDCAAFFEWNMSRFLRGTFRNALKGILASKLHGYSVSEAIHSPTVWEGKPKWAVRAIKPKPFHTFRRGYDEYGNLTEFWQEIGGKRIDLDPRKFIIHLSNSDRDPVWGVSDLQAAYRPWLSKTNLQKFWDIYLERAGGGFGVAKVTEEISAPAQAALQATLDSLSTQTAIALPKGVDFDYKVPPHNEAFEHAVAERNTSIARALLMPTLLGFAPEQRTGAYAQSQTHETMFLMVMGNQGDELADTLNEQLFRPLALWNFGLEDYPVLEFDPFSDKEKREIVTAWRDAVEKGIVINTDQDEARTRELLDYDERRDDAVPTDKEKMDLIPQPEPLADANGEKPQPGEKPKPEPDKKVEAAAKFSQVRNAYLWRERIDYSAVGRDMASLNGQTVEQVSEAVSQAFDALTGEMSRIQGAISGNDADYETELARMDTAIPRTVNRAINRGFRTGIGSAYDQGRASAIEEIEKAAGLLDDERMALRLRQAARYSRRSGVKGAWSVANFAQGLDLVTAEKYLEAKAFEMAGDLSDKLKQAAKQILIDGIKNEKSVPEMVKELEKLLGPYLGEFDEQGRKINLGHRLETIVRTNLTDAFNQARLAVYNDPDLGDFVEAYEYSAILDSRTTPFCRTADGKIYRKSDPVWASIVPPNHYNCRSLLIPVTELDEWEQGQPLPDTVRPEVGFG